ncbi:MAG: DMT family transporter [Candidatus Thermoplasmatota archaeon]|jgi:EamA-like transporter family.|nr:DMT family transporter [Candidatus Thermoplasmatota archaeon]
MECDEKMESKSLFYILLLLLATISWGLTFPLINLSLQLISPVIFLFIRFLISSIILLPLVGIKKLRTRGGEVEGIIAGFLLFIGYYFQTVGLKFTTPADSGIITGLYVVIVPLLSYVYLKSKVSRIDWAAVLIAMIGLIILSDGVSGSSSVEYGNILTVICAIGYALQIAYVSKHSSRIDSMKFTFYQMFTVAVFSLITIPTFTIYYDLLSPLVIFTLIFTAIFAGIMGYFLINRALIYVKPEKAGVVLVTEPIFAAIFSYILVDDKIGIYTIIGGAIMISAMFISVIDAYLRSKNNLTHPVVP